MTNLISSSQQVNDVYKTNDLSVFKSLNGNRPVNLQHVKRLVDSIRIHGVLQSPIIVNGKGVVIDGQHRLAAARETGSEIYYVIVKDYDLDEVHILNLNQKNWTKRDFMEGYAKMGILSYMKLKQFSQENRDFNLSDCLKMASNNSGNNYAYSKKFHDKTDVTQRSEVFEEGTWKGADFKLAQEWAEKLRMVKPYYAGYNRAVFVSTMIGLFKNPKFDFMEFLRKLKYRSTELVDCANVDQYKLLIEDIYNHRKQDKVNLRY